MTKAEQTREFRFRLRFLKYFEEVSYFGISRQNFYKWKARYDEFGEAGLISRSNRPHHQPRKTRPEVVEKILYLRKHYHFGAGRISAYLKRFHEISIAASSVHRILTAHGMPRLPANQKHTSHRKRWKRYEKQRPGHRVQVDVKFLHRIPGTRKRFYQFTAIDDCTRVRVLKIYDKCNQGTAVDFINHVKRRLPFRILTVQTDNGAEFQSHFHWHLANLDIRHVYIKPRTPRLNGKVERSHRIDQEEFYRVLDTNNIREDIHLFNGKLREWEDYYNFHRPHGGLAGQTPYEKLISKTKEAETLSGC